MAAIGINIPDSRNTYNTSPDFEKQNLISSHQDQGHGHSHGHGHGHSHSGHGHSHTPDTHMNMQYNTSYNMGSSPDHYGGNVRSSDNFHTDISGKKKRNFIMNVFMFILEMTKEAFELLWDGGQPRNLMLYFILNFSFAFVELIVGYWSNSLSLQSDAWHMFNDSMATFWACLAFVVLKWPRSRKYTFGYRRIEVLCAFVNCCFLLYIGFNILREACHRMFDPEDLQHDHLLSVSVAGLIVNLLGVFAFGHSHSHGGDSHGHSHSNDHGHSHGEKGGNVLISSVHAHILVDTLGSVAVIVAGRLDLWFGWKRADPVCSLLLAGFILFTVRDTLGETFSILLMGTRDDQIISAKNCRNEIMNIQGVRECRVKDIWSLTTDKHFANCIILVENTMNLSMMEQLRYHIEQIFKKNDYTATVIFTANEQILFQ